MNKKGRVVDMRLKDMYFKMILNDLFVGNDKVNIENDRIWVDYITYSYDNFNNLEALLEKIQEDLDD